MTTATMTERSWYCRKCGGRGNPREHRCPIAGECPDCGAPWTLGREADGKVHTPGGLDCLRRQRNAAISAVRDLSAAIDGIEQAVGYEDMQAIADIARTAERVMDTYPRRWFFDEAEAEADDR